MTLRDLGAGLLVVGAIVALALAPILLASCGWPRTPAAPVVNDERFEIVSTQASREHTFYVLRDTKTGHEFLLVRSPSSTALEKIR